MNHYEALGVSRDASTDDIRRAYVRLARQHHPDFHTSAGRRSQLAAETRMRELNVAWQVLGSDSSRSAYDRSLRNGVPSTGGLPVTPDGPVVRPPSSAFRPFAEHDEDDDDSWRYEPDVGDPASVPPRALLVAPPALALAGVALLAVSLSTGLDVLVALGLICLVFSALLFVGAPVAALFRSRSAEERASRRR